MNSNEQRIAWIKKEIKKEYYQLLRDTETKIDYRNEIIKCQKKKEKYIALFEKDIITIDALKVECDRIDKTIHELEELLSFTTSIGMVYTDIDLDREVEKVLNRIKEEKEYIASYLDNRILKLWIEKIVVEASGNIKVYLK